MTLSIPFGDPKRYIWVTLTATFCDPECYVWWPQALHLVTPSPTFGDLQLGDPKRYIWWPWPFHLVTPSATFGDPKNYIWWPPSAKIWWPRMLEYFLLRPAFAWFSISARESILVGASLSGRDWANWGHALQYWTVCSSYQLTPSGMGKGGKGRKRWGGGEMTCQVSLTAGCLNPILRPAHERGIRHIVATAESMRIDLHTLLYKAHVCEYIHRGQRNSWT